MGDLYAVLTGDLVKSSRLSKKQLTQAREHLEAAAAELNRWKRGLVRGKPDFFRGDAWQVLLSEPKWALRAAVFLRASLLAEGRVDTRIAIGLGAVDEVAGRRISLSSGQAFVLSGQSLDEMTQYYQMTIALPEKAGILGGWVSVTGQLCDALIGHWTSRQAAVVRVALRMDDATHDEIARRLKPRVKRQTVTRALGGASWTALRSALRLFEDTPWRKVF